jgi:hypothetical protein
MQGLNCPPAVSRMRGPQLAEPDLGVIPAEGMSMKQHNPFPALHGQGPLHGIAQG